MSGHAPLSVLYLLEDTAIFGGVKVILHQANLLHRRGHHVTILSKGEPPSWFPLEAAFERRPSFDDALPAADVTVATYWTTILPAIRHASGEVAHYCQGFEGSYTHNREQHREILAAYREPLPALAVALHLVRLLNERFARPGWVVPQPLEPFWRPRRFRWRPNTRPRVLVPSPFEIDWKGVPTSLEALVQLRREGLGLDLVRISQWPQTAEERKILAAEEFHVQLAPRQVADLVRSCDLSLAASWEQEGFGLPVLEAMACGVPVVASNVSCFKDYSADSALLVPFDRPAAFAAAARLVLSEPRVWRRMRRDGLRVARAYTESRAAEGAEMALRWVASGAWRKELSRLRRTPPA